MDDLLIKKQTRRIMAGLFMQVAGLTVGVIVMAILIGMWIGQQTGEQSFLNWLPLFIALPINLWISSRLGKIAVHRITTLRYGQKDAPRQETKNE